MPATKLRPPIREVLRANIIFERARARMSQAALAEAAGLTRQTISDVERCVANPTIDALERIANALGVTLDRLLVPPIAERAKRGDKADRVNARDLLATVADAAGRPSRRYSNAGRPRLGD